MERRGLGRGLSALMADVNLDSAADNAAAGAAERQVPIDRVRPNPNQPRRQFAPEALRDLTDSIRQKGVLQPLIVRALPGDEGYEIVAGERRWRASQAAGLHKVPVIVRDFTDQEVIEVAIIENIQRADLSPIEEAQAYRQLIERYGHTQEKVAEVLSRSRSHVANLLRLLTLPDDVQAMIGNGGLTAGHARALIGAPNAKELALQVVGKGLTVRATEDLMRKSSVPRAARRRPPQEKDADTRAIEGDLAANLGMAVTITHEPGGERGRLTISYNSLADLDFLCQVLSMARPEDIL